MASLSFNWVTLIVLGFQLCIPCVHLLTSFVIPTSMTETVRRYGTPFVSKFLQYL